MRRLILTVALMAATIAVAPSTASAQTPAQACSQRAQTASGVRALIRCIAPRLGVSTSHALYVADRESNFDPTPTADGCNSSNHCGTYQDAAAIWAYEVQHYVYGSSMRVLLQPGCSTGHFTTRGRCSGRANVILNLRYVRHHGWAPWGG